MSAFEVSNKVIEMLMLRAGIDVCCVGEEDVTRADRLVDEGLHRHDGVIFVAIRFETRARARGDGVISTRDSM